MILRTVHGNRQPGRCRACRAHIAWVWRVSTLGTTRVPINLAAIPMREEVHPVTGLRFDIWDLPTTLHFVTCKKGKR